MPFDISINYVEFAAIALIHFFAVASPGPDFAIVLKQSMQQGRSAALWTSFGIGSGILLHVAYSLLGISIVIKTTPWLFSLLLYLAAAYLLWIGFSALRSPAINATEQKEGRLDTNMSVFKAYALGFITNGLNPKATLFFLSVFTVAIAPDTGIVVKGIYGVYMAIATAAWFSFLSLLMSHAKVRHFYLAKGYVFDRVMGAVLITMAVLLLFNN